MKKYFFIIALLFPVMLYAQKNWQWRGETRTGVYNETGLLKVWPADGPQMLWKHEGLGEGFTSVAIAGGKVYVTGITDDKLMLYIFDLKGQLLNKKEVGKEWTTNHVGTRCSVDVNDGKLYIGNSLGHMHCLDEATLNEVWKVDLIADYGGRNLRWGMTENPLIAGDKIFLTPGGTTHNMIALNKKTGALIWTTTGLGLNSAYCSPQFIGDQSIPMVVTCIESNIIAYNADTGEKLWSHPQPNGNVTIHPNTPMYVDGMIFSITGYRGGAWLYRLKDGGKAAELVWKNDEMDCQMGGAIKVGDYVYASGHNFKGWYCVDWKTGETKYKANEIGRANVIFADGMLYVYDEEKGTMNLVKPNPDKFDLVSSFKVTLGTGPHWAHPVIHQGVLYVRHGDALMAYKVK